MAVVDTGEAFVMSRITSDTATVMSHMAIGSGGTAVSDTDTTLGTELGRVAFDSATPSGSSVTYVATFPAGTGTGTVAEMGIFNAASAGTMLSRKLFSAAIPKGSGDSLEVTYVLTAD